MSKNQALPKKEAPLSLTDYESDQEVRWCPGCGDYAILKAVQKALVEMQIPKENLVFVSGIGCASRFPYYLDTYGFHTIHGRAPTIATGIKLARPDLSVWIITGDGDALSIGSNHLIHLMRRNINVNVLLINNQIYGLTKGQYSPTSQTGLKTKSSPTGSLETPIDPIALALSANCSFVARAIDIDQSGLTQLLIQAEQHDGTSFIEIYQNCHVYNDGVFDTVRPSDLRAQNTLTLKPGAPLVFGKNQEHGLILRGNEKTSDSKPSVERIEIHSPQDLSQVSVYRADRTSAHQINALTFPDYPVPIGLFYQEKRPPYETQMHLSIREAQKKKTTSLQDCFQQGNTWEVL